MLEVPEIAIEVVVSSGLLDKLEVYGCPGVLEVWVFERRALTVYRLKDGAYRSQDRSEELPGLELGQLASLVRVDAKQSAAVRAYRAELRASVQC